MKKVATGVRQKVRFWLRMLSQVRRPQDGQAPAVAATVPLARIVRLIVVRDELQVGVLQARRADGQLRQFEPPADRPGRQFGQ